MDKAFSIVLRLVASIDDLLQNVLFGHGNSKKGLFDLLDMNL